MYKKCYVLYVVCIYMHRYGSDNNENDFLPPLPWNRHREKQNRHSEEQGRRDEEQGRRDEE